MRILNFYSFTASNSIFVHMHTLQLVNKAFISKKAILESCIVFVVITVLISV
jgi:hypothetical protein